MIKIYNLWTLLGLAIYYWGPIDWIGASSPNVAIYVLACLAAFNLGARYRFNERRVALARLPYPRSTTICYTIVIVYMVLTFIQLRLVTGRDVFDPGAYSLNFGAVYTQYGETLADADRTTLSATFLSVIKAAAFPFVLLIFVERFRRDKLIIGLIVGPMVISSLFRGTDKELLDIVILTFVAAAYHGLLTRRIVAYIIGTPFAVALFAVRRSERFQNSLPTCLPNSQVCFDYQSWQSQHLGYGAEQAWVFVTNYVTNGYQGLDYALQLGWSPNYGLGEFPPLQNAVCRVVSFTCNVSTYNDRLSAGGWDTSTRWTTAYTTLANDVTFWLVPLLMVLLGIVYSKSRVLWRSERNPEALAAIVIISMFWIYASANLQTAINMDWVAASLFFIYYALFRRTRIPEEMPIAKRTASTGAGRAAL